MVYRIRFQEADRQSEGQTLVEAHSPAEAMVKFQHVGRGGPAGRGGPRVTSVQAETNDGREEW